VPFIDWLIFTSTNRADNAPCREGTGWLEDVLIRMEKREADKREIPCWKKFRQIEGSHHLRWGDAAAWLGPDSAFQEG
jgi:NADH:ubiquinone oxidoreductase subunit F (NADH-binding)